MEFKVGHVGLNVSDLDRSKAFYADLLGLETVHETRENGRDYAFLIGNGLFLTLWQQSAGEFSPATPGLHHLAFEVESVEAVAEFEAKLRAANVPQIYDGIVSHGEGMDSGGVYFLDPDGIRLEVYTGSGVADFAVPTPGAASCGFF